MSDSLFRVRVRTTPTITDWRAAILGAAAALDLHLTEGALSVCWAQFAVETGRGKACWCNNWGNRRARPGEPYCELAGAWECGPVAPVGSKIIAAPPGASCPAGQVVYLLPSSAQRFAAFDTIEEGALDYLRFLSRPSYALAWSALQRGDAGAFAHALKVLHYYTADEGQYAAGLRSLVAEYFRATAVAPADATPTRPETPAARESGLVLGTDGAITSLGHLEGRHHVDPDDTSPGFSWSAVVADLEAQLGELRGSLACSTCHDPDPPREAA